MPPQFLPAPWRRWSLYALFFWSGIPALLYEVIWQRSLLTVYGTRIESVTIVVSAFMLGLGLGGLAGGWLSRRRVSGVLLFGAAEIGVGLFGTVSLTLFQQVGMATAGASPVARGMVIFLILLVPTVLMGMTLPILVRQVARAHVSVAGSVGGLWFANTLGSALACFAAAFFAMHWLGKAGTIRVAAMINLSVGVLALAHYATRRGRRRPSPLPGPAPARAVNAALPFPMAAIVTGVIGFIAMGYQLVWYRVYSFGSGGSSQAFAVLLGCFLIGSAAGAAAGGAMCAPLSGLPVSRRRAITAGLVLLGSLYAFAVAPAASYAAVSWRYEASLALVPVATFLFGATFPLIVHAAVPSEDARPGARVGALYMSNSLGAVLGGIVVGYVLMDRWSVAGLSKLLACSGVLLGIGILRRHRASLTQRAGTGVAVATALAAIVWATDPLFDRMYERLQLKDDFTPGYRFAQVVENRSGVITVTPDDVVFSSGIYDGQVNLDVVHDTNGIARAYSMSLWHPAPRSVLMVGIGSGSWAQVVAHHPQVEHLTIVEINPGYLPLIAARAPVASLLANPAVRIDIDGGRRWLALHPDARFDVILMNTTYPWRARASDVLSADFLEIVRQHLHPGGVLFYNSTFAPEAERTGLSVFPYGFRFGSCIAVSDSPIVLDWDRLARTLRAYRVAGTPVFNFTRPADTARFAELTDRGLERPDGLGIERARAILARTTGSRIITDDNMGTEWRSPVLQKLLHRLRVAVF